MTTTPAVPGALNIPTLTGHEIVEVTSGGSRKAQTTTQAIANLAPPASSLTLTDGTHTVASVGQITVTGGTVGGATPNATLAIAGGGLTGFTSSLVTTAPNDTINASVLAASGGTLIQDIVLAVKGTADDGFGAISLQVPDGTSTGGNKRGANAIDLQSFRATPGQVASGGFSFAWGQLCTASGDNSFAGGLGNTASGNNSHAEGNGTRASGIGSHSEGNHTTASGLNSHAEGVNTVASGANSHAEGDGTVASGISSYAGGRLATSRGITSAEAFGAGGSSPGQFQRGHYVLGAITADATPAVLTADQFTAGALNQVTLPNGANGALGAAYKFRGQVVATDTATGHSSGWDFTGTIKQAATAGSTALVAAVTPTLAGQDAALAATVVAISADITIGALAITVTGIAATNIHWMCDVQTSETTY
jgi:hypothetical protein